MGEECPVSPHFGVSLGTSCSDPAEAGRSVLATSRRFIAVITVGHVDDVHDHAMAEERRDDDPEQHVRPPGFSRVGTRVLEVAENLIYGGIALFLVLSAFVLLAVAAKTSWGVVSDFSEKPLLEVLDVLLLVFIVVELLFAVRTTVEKRELVAEPFLLVGIIASIKEIVVLSVEAAGVLGKGEEFDDRIIEIGLLGVLVVLLGVTSFLLRRKEREPDEGEPAPTRSGG
jgi:uncharacterized membrane protein (DUF373 family)